MKKGLVAILMLALSALFLIPSSCDKLGVKPDTPCDTLWFEHFNQRPTGGSHPWWPQSDSWDLWEDGPVAGAAPCLRIFDPYSMNVTGVITMKPPRHTYTRVTLTFWMKIEIQPGKSDLESFNGTAVVHNWYEGFLPDTVWQANLAALQTNKWIKVEVDVTDLWNRQVPQDTVSIYLKVTMWAEPDTGKTATIFLYLDEVVLTATPSAQEGLSWLPPSPPARVHLTPTSLGHPQTIRPG